MNKTKYRNILTILITLIIVIALLIGTDALFAERIERNKMQGTIDKYSTILSDIVELEKKDVESSVITEKYIAYNNSNVIMATLYSGTLDNAYGSITIRFAISNNIVMGIEADVDQSLHKDKTLDTINNFKLKDLSKVKEVDAIAGATISVNTANEIINELLKVHEIVNLEPTHPRIISKTEVKENDAITAYTYKTKGSGVSYGSNEGSIEVYFTVNIDNVITDVTINDSNYGHTLGYKGYLDETINNLGGINISELVIADIDTSTGATNTTTLLLELLKVVKEDLANE